MPTSATDELLPAVLSETGAYMGNRGKLRREKKANARENRMAQERTRKVRQRARCKAAVADASTATRRLRLFLDFLWRATGGPLVAITGWSPFSKKP